MFGHHKLIQKLLKAYQQGKLSIEPLANKKHIFYKTL